MPDLEDLDDDIRRIVAAFDKLQDACKMKKSTSVKLGSTHLLSVRLVPSLIKAYRQAMAESPGSAVPKVELVYDMHYRKENEREFYAAPDLSLTYRARETEEISMAANSSMSRDTTGASSRETIIRSPSSRNKLKVATFNGRYLRNTTVAILQKDAGIPNFPYESVASSAQLLLVRAVIEAHEHVRAGNADIAFTHIDPLDRNELRDFTVIRLSHLAEFGKTRLCLLRRVMAHSRTKKTRSTH